MIEENAGNPISNKKKDWESELFQDTNRAIWTHLEQPQIKLETNRKFDAFWASA